MLQHGLDSNCHLHRTHHLTPPKSGKTLTAPYADLDVILINLHEELIALRPNILKHHDCRLLLKCLKIRWFMMVGRILSHCLNIYLKSNGL